MHWGIGQPTGAIGMTLAPMKHLDTAFRSQAMGLSAFLAIPNFPPISEMICSTEQEGEWTLHWRRRSATISQSLLTPFWERYVRRAAMSLLSGSFSGGSIVVVGASGRTEDDDGGHSLLSV